MKKLRLFLSALMLSVSSLGVLVAPHAFAATRTWTGTAGDHKFSTASNWGGVAPSSGDALVFDNTSASDLDPNNDMSSASFASITFQGSGASGFTISGNAFTLTGGITSTAAAGSSITANVTATGSQTFATGAANLFLNGTLSGSGSITKTGAGALYIAGDNSSYSGTLTASAGNVTGEAAHSFGTTGAVINDGADVALASCTAFDLASPLTLTGASTDATNIPKLYIVVGACVGGAADETYGTPSNNTAVNITGAVTLGSDITFAGLPATTTLSGALSGAHSINLMTSFNGKLVVAGSSNTTTTPNGTYNPPVFQKTLSDDQSAHTVNIQGNTIITLDGKRGDTTVGKGSTLMGTGSTGNLGVLSGGTVAPGHSPGCLAATGGLVLAGTYQAEIGGTTPCTGYDQLKVTGTVDITGATLAASLYNGFKPAKGQTYTIVDNDASDAVTGTFSGLAEGATFNLNGYVLSVSYKGGDGNDVVLSVQSVPAAPNTGFTLIKDNPILTAGLIVATAGGMLVLARRNKHAARR